MQHLSTKIQKKVVNLFLKYKNIWLCPKEVQAIKYIAEFEVEEPLIKMKLRLLAPEL